jgi:hypothetical protein
MITCPTSGYYLERTKASIIWGSAITTPLAIHAAKVDHTDTYEILRNDTAVKYDRDTARSR